MNRRGINLHICFGHCISLVPEVSKRCTRKDTRIELNTIQLLNYSLEIQKLPLRWIMKHDSYNIWPMNSNVNLYIQTLLEKVYNAYKQISENI